MEGGAELLSSLYGFLKREYSGLTASLALNYARRLTPVFKFDAANALKTAELLGKHLIMFTDKVDCANSDGTLSSAQMTEEQVTARLVQAANCAINAPQPACE